VVDELIREMLFSAVNRVRAEGVAKKQVAQIINWVPDTWTLLQVIRTLPASKEVRIAYPGDGLPRIELERLTQVLPRLSLQSFEHLTHRNHAAKPPGKRHRGKSRSNRIPVLLSVSDPPLADLARNGFRGVHLDDVAVRIGQRGIRKALRLDALHNPSARF
jgi:hypothetical protein